MNKYIAFIKPKHPFNPITYPTFFAFFETIPRGYVLSANAFLFQHSGDEDAVHGDIRQHLQENDEVIVFHISKARWTLADEDSVKSLMFALED